MPNHSNKIIILLLLILSFASCKIFQPQPVAIGDLIIYPPPPDTVRLQYLTSISNSEDIKGKRSPFMDFILGKEVPMGIVSPLEIATSENELIICDNIAKGIEIINFEKQTFDFFIPEDKGKLVQPVSCELDDAGNLYFIDKKLQEIVIFDKTENGYKFKTRFGDSTDFAPYDIMVFKNKIWVPNTKTRKINVYDAVNYNLLFTFPKSDDINEANIILPKYIEGYNDNIYVTDFVGNTVKVYDLNGYYQRSVGSIGTYPGNFARAKDLAIDRDENLFVVDAAFGNVQIFNNSGQLLLFFGGQNGNNADMLMPRAIHIAYTHNKYFEEYLNPNYNLKYIIYVSNQHGENKINVYGAVEEKKD